MHAVTPALWETETAGSLDLTGWPTSPAYWVSFRPAVERVGGPANLEGACETMAKVVLWLPTCTHTQTQG